MPDKYTTLYNYYDLGKGWHVADTNGLTNWEDFDWSSPNSHLPEVTVTVPKLTLVDLDLRKKNPYYAELARSMSGISNEEITTRKKELEEAAKQYKPENLTDLTREYTPTQLKLELERLAKEKELKVRDTTADILQGVADGIGMGVSAINPTIGSLYWGATAAMDANKGNYMGAGMRALGAAMPGVEMYAPKAAPWLNGAMSSVIGAGSATDIINNGVNADNAVGLGLSLMPLANKQTLNTASLYTKNATRAARKTFRSLVLGPWRAKLFVELKWPEHAQYMGNLLSGKGDYYDKVLLYADKRVNNARESHNAQRTNILGMSLTKLDLERNRLTISVDPTGLPSWYLNPPTTSKRPPNPEKFSLKNAVDYITKHLPEETEVTPSFKNGVFEGFSPKEELYTSETGLNNFVNTGTVSVPDFDTGQSYLFSISLPKYQVSGDVKPVYDIYGNYIGQLDQYRNVGLYGVSLEGNPMFPTGIRYNELSIDPGYAEALQRANEHLINKFKGIKGLGSSLTAAYGGFPHGTHDFDFFVTLEDYLNNIANHPELSNARQIRGNSSDPITYRHNYQSDTWGSNDDALGVLDFNIVNTDPNSGMATGTNASELFRQYFPDDYSWALRQSKINGMATGDYTLPINKTARELMDVYDPITKTIMDSFEINFKRKHKHAGRPMVLLSYANPLQVQKGLHAWINSMLGHKHQLPPRIDPKHFSDTEANKILLKELGIPVDIDVVALDPEKMLNALDYWHTYNTTFMRSFNMGDRGESLVTDITKSLRNATEWNSSLTNGGNYNGFGLNLVRLGDSGENQHVFGFVQPYIDYTGVETPRQILDKVYHTTGRFNLSEEEANIINELIANYVPDSNYRMKAGLPLSELLSNSRFRRSGEDLEALGNALYDKLGVNVIVTPKDYNTGEVGAKYASGIRKFNGDKDAVLIFDNSDPIPGPIENRREIMNANSVQETPKQRNLRGKLRSEYNRLVREVPITSKKEAIKLAKRNTEFWNGEEFTDDKRREVLKAQDLFNRRRERIIRLLDDDYWGPLFGRYKQKLLAKEDKSYQDRVNFWNKIARLASLNKAKLLDTAASYRGSYRSTSYYDSDGVYHPGEWITPYRSPIRTKFYRAANQANPSSVGGKVIGMTGAAGFGWLGAQLAGMIHRNNYIDNLAKLDSEFQKLDSIYNATGRYNPDLQNLNRRYLQLKDEYNEKYPWGRFILGSHYRPKKAGH